MPTSKNQLFYETNLGSTDRRSLINTSKTLYNNLVLERTAELRELNNMGVVVFGTAFLMLFALSCASLVTVFMDFSPQFVHSFFDALPRIMLNQTPIIPEIYLAILLAAIISFTLAKAIGQWMFAYLKGVIMLQRKLLKGRPARENLLTQVQHILRFEPNRITNDQANVKKGGRVFRKNHPITEATMRLRSQEHPEKAIIIRRTMEKKPFLLYLLAGFRSPRPEEQKVKSSFWEDNFGHYFRHARILRNAIKMSLVYRELGCELRDETPDGEHWRRNYFSEKNRQLTSLFDTRDIHMRFRTGTPHLRWPVPSNASSMNETALYRAYACVENPINQPLFLLAVSDIISCIELVVGEFENQSGDDEESTALRRRKVAETINTLMSTELEMFGKWDPHTLNYDGEAATKREAILRVKDANLSLEDLEANMDHLHLYDWQLRWDPNYVNWLDVSDEKEASIGRAFAVLFEAISRAAKTATPIILHRGDVLIIDNLRCLLARREVQAIPPLKQALNFPQEWWLHGYYAFRQSTGGEFHQAD